MLSKTRLIFLFLFFLLIVASALSQPKKNMYGISAAISEGFLTSHNIYMNGPSLNIGVAYIFSDQLSLRGDLGFRSQKDTSGDKSSEFTFTANLWYYLHTIDNLSTFIGGSLGLGSASDYNGSGTSILSLGGFLGGEYWISSKFSCFGHIGIIYASYVVTDKSAWDLYSSAAVGLTWYLN